MRLLIPVLCVCAAVLSAGDAKPANQPILVNAQVAPHETALNQPVRLEFTTMPRQVDGIDIAAAVTNALMLGGSEDWRLLGKPLVVESDAKIKLVSVSVTLLPRRSGDRPIPDVPISWLQGNYMAHVSPVKVLDRIQVAGVTRELPKETDSLSGWKWGADSEELEKRVPPSQVEKVGERVRIKAEENLVLEFVDKRLAQATMTVADIDLEQARISFLERWGLPMEETQGQLRWILGWTVITASTKEGGKGIVLLFQREDILGNVAKSQVKTKVFDVLDRGR